MKNYLYLIKLLKHEFESLDLLKSLDKADNTFFDEPKRYSYTAIINSSSEYIKSHNYLISPTRKVFSNGFSFHYKYLALLKCLSECAERLCMLCYAKQSIIKSDYLHIKDTALDPSVFVSDNNIRSRNFGWIKGFNLTNDSSCYLPAQLIYLNYHHYKYEIPLSVSISTGAAGGFNREETLLRCIYEVVERDAFMTVYLTKISPKRIDLDSFQNIKIKHILNQCKRYKLQIYLFDITNNLKIPSFLTLLLDQSNIGPAVTVGLKTGLNIHNAIIGSMEEAFLTRSWLRYEFIKKKTDSHKYIKRITRLSHRGLYWYHRNMLKHLDFLLEEKPHEYSFKPFVLDAKAELTTVVKQLMSYNYQIFFADITLDFLKKINFFAYKAIIPNLQPLYLEETKRKINIERLKQVSDYFCHKFQSINKIPHPFL